MASEAGKGDKRRPTDTELFEANFDLIFRKKEAFKKTLEFIEEHSELFEMLKESEQQDKDVGNKTIDPITKPFPHNILRQSRMDTIGQNGNEGIHYDSDDAVDRWSAVLRDEYDSKYWKDQ
jgi:hypothetical protein